MPELCKLVMLYNQNISTTLVAVLKRDCFCLILDFIVLIKNKKLFIRFVFVLTRSHMVLYLVVTTGYRLSGVILLLYAVNHNRFNGNIMKLSDFSFSTFPHIPHLFKKNRDQVRIRFSRLLRFWGKLISSKNKFFRFQK